MDRGMIARGRGENLRAGEALFLRAWTARRGTEAGPSDLQLCSMIGLFRFQRGFLMLYFLTL